MFQHWHAEIDRRHDSSDRLSLFRLSSGCGETAWIHRSRGQARQLGILEKGQSSLQIKPCSRKTWIRLTYRLKSLVEIIHERDIR